MTFKIAAQKAINSMFSNLGEPAVYQPQNRENQEIFVVKRQPDEVINALETRVHTSSCLLNISAEKVPIPTAGDRIIIGSTTFLVKGEPIIDQHNLVWQIEVENEA